MSSGMASPLALGGHPFFRRGSSPLSYRCTMRHVLLALPTAALLAACTPHNIAMSTCESIMLATGEPWSCTVKGDLVSRSSSIEFDTESRNQIAQVKIALTVTKGKLRVGYWDLTGEQHVLVTPSEPATLDMRTRMHPQRRSFTLSFEPVDGAVEGLAGTVRYSTP